MHSSQLQRPGPWPIRPEIFQARHRLARMLLGPLLSYLAFYYEYLARKWVRFIQSYMPKSCNKQTHFLASPVHRPADYKNCRYAYSVGRCLFQDIQLVERYSWLDIATFLNFLQRGRLIWVRLWDIFHGLAQRPEDFSQKMKARGD